MIQKILRISLVLTYQVYVAQARPELDAGSQPIKEDTGSSPV